MGVGGAAAGNPGEARARGDPSLISSVGSGAPIGVERGHPAPELGRGQGPPPAHPGARQPLDREVGLVGGRHLPGTVMVRVVSSRNLSVQYTEGLEHTKQWLRVKAAGAQEACALL